MRNRKYPVWIPTGSWLPRLAISFKPDSLLVEIYPDCQVIRLYDHVAMEDDAHIVHWILVECNGDHPLLLVCPLPQPLVHLLRSVKECVVGILLRLLAEIYA